MTTFLFRFGFCTPAQWLSNSERERDDESSQAFFVRAESSEAAESWGREIADRFCHQLFARSKAWTEEIPSWRESAFASWIESDLNSLPKEYLEHLPTIDFGEVPDLGRWLESS